MKGHGREKPFIVPIHSTPIKQSNKQGRRKDLRFFLFLRNLTFLLNPKKRFQMSSYAHTPVLWIGVVHPVYLACPATVVVSIL